MRFIVAIYIYLILVLPGCKKDFGGYVTRDFVGNWTLRALLDDKNGNGFDSADIIQHIPQSAHMEMRLFDNGKVEHWNKTDNYLNGTWFLTEKPNKNDPIQWIFLRPDMWGGDNDNQIVSKTNNQLILYYYKFLYYDSNKNAVYARKGYLYEK